MDRPSKEAVEGALAHYAEEAQCAIERNCAGILAAEVRALRSELVDYKDAVKTWAANVRDRVAERDAARATIARVEALPAEWQNETLANGYRREAGDCAIDLLAALKGEP